MSHRFRLFRIALFLSLAHPFGVSPAAADEPAAPAAAPADGEMLNSIERVRTAMRGMVETDVRAALRDARERMATDPEGVVASLAAESARVRIAPELNPADRDRLLAYLFAASREAARCSSSAHLSAVHAQEVEAEQHARRELHRDLVTRQRTIEKQLAHTNDLAARGEYRAAEEAAASLGDGNSSVVGTTAPLEAHMKVNHFEMQALAARRRQHLEEEFQNQDRQRAVDSDGQPIVYPSVEKWNQLSERRREYRENASFYRPGAGERKINQALQSVISVDFQETPLADVLDYLKHKCGIEIQFDAKGLSEESIGPSTPITKNLNDVKLRSVLRLILGDLNLAYVVKDDILLITSIESADSMTTTRVYDAADLLLPIPNPFNNIYLPGGGMPF